MQQSSTLQAIGRVCIPTLQRPPPYSFTFELPHSLPCLCTTHTAVVFSEEAVCSLQLSINIFWANLGVWPLLATHLLRLSLLQPTVPCTKTYRVRVGEDRGFPLQSFPRLDIEGLCSGKQVFHKRGWEWTWLILHLFPFSEIPRVSKGGPI